MVTVTHTVLHHMVERAGKGLIRQVAQTSKWWTKLASKVQIWAPISPLLPLVHTGSQSSDLFTISESSADKTPGKPPERSNKTTGSKQDSQPSISTFLHREFYDHRLDRNIWRASWCQGQSSAAAGVVLYGLAEVWIAPLNLTDTSVWLQSFSLRKQEGSRFPHGNSSSMGKWPHRRIHSFVRCVTDMTIKCVRAQTSHHRELNMRDNYIVLRIYW